MTKEIVRYTYSTVSVFMITDFIDISITKTEPLR